VVFEAPKDATPVGTLAGLQLLAVPKSLLPGFVSHCAFWAMAVRGETSAKPASRTANRNRRS
jgi:hypothetical protein